jgi:hypothetical protein
VRQSPAAAVAGCAARRAAILSPAAARSRPFDSLEPRGDGRQLWLLARERVVPELHLARRTSPKFDLAPTPAALNMSESPAP